MVDRVYVCVRVTRDAEYGVRVRGATLIVDYCWVCILACPAPNHTGTEYRSMIDCAETAAVIPTDAIDIV